MIPLAFAPFAARAACLAQSTGREILFWAALGGLVVAWAIAGWSIYRARRRQSELLRLQRRFVADVSHELKTPLALIRMLAETLRDGRVRDVEKRQQYLDTITREGERLSALLDAILDFSQIESGKRKMQMQSCDVAEAARQAWALFEPQFARDGFDARLAIAPDVPVIQADPLAIQQVMVNLLQNAYRYAGGGKFVRLSVERDGYVVLIRVEDHGIGMNREQLERLGDSFYRADDTRVRQTRGAGLGLAIVNHIVTAHHGKLEVHSRPSQGSEFTVWIPFEPEGEPAKSA